MVGFSSRALGRHLAVTAIVVLAVAYSASAASAADVNVGAGGCILGQGGHVTRPAGSTIVVRFGWEDKTRGNVVSFVKAQSTSVVINGGTAVDLSNAYEPSATLPDGQWASFVSYPTGVLLANPGDTLTFSISVSLPRLHADVTNGLDGYTPGPPLFYGPGIVFSGTCTVTAF